jgi:hypothetical protein
MRVFGVVWAGSVRVLVGRPGVGESVSVGIVVSVAVGVTVLVGDAVGMTVFESTGVIVGVAIGVVGDAVAVGLSIPSRIAVTGINVVGGGCSGQSSDHAPSTISTSTRNSAMLAANRASLWV